MPDRRAGRRSRPPPDELEQHRRRRALHYRRVVEEGALYAQPFSEGGVYDGPARMTPFETVPGGSQERH